METNHESFKTALQIARCSDSDKPPEECVSRVTSFLEGSDCDAKDTISEFITYKLIGIFMSRAGEPSSIQRMNSSVVATLVCVLVALTLVEGRRPPPRGPSPGVKALIPACLPFSNAVEERIRDVEDELSRPRDCPEENIEECIRRDVNIIRCGLKEKPSEECIDQIVSFLQNDKCTE
ncbi:UNVERIFIED_CONTAM: hypothetical protein NCL1_10905 [Trichonephila clavipes]